MSTASNFQRSPLRGRRSQQWGAVGRACWEVLEDRRLMSFAPAVSYAAGTDLTEIIAADFNNDGRLDLVVANPTANSVNVLLGNGNGTFQSPQTSAAGANPRSIAVGRLQRRRETRPGGGQRRHQRRERDAGQRRRHLPRARSASASAARSRVRRRRRLQRRRQAGPRRDSNLRPTTGTVTTATPRARSTYCWGSAAAHSPHRGRSVGTGPWVRSS